MHETRTDIQTGCAFAISSVGRESSVVISVDN